MSRTLKIFFTVSVVMNLLLLGVAGGMAYKEWSRHSWRGEVANLAPETRNAMARAFQKTHKDIRPIGEKARRLRKEMMNILSAETFDEKKFDAAVRDFEKIQEEMMDVKIAAMKELASDLPAAERKKLAEKLSGFFDRSRGRRHKYDHPKRPDGPEKD